MTPEQRELLRPGFEAAIIERFKESGFLEVEIRVECLSRCGESYNDPQVAIAWWSWAQSRESLVVELPPRVTPEECASHLDTEDDDLGSVVSCMINGAIIACGGMIKAGGGGIREPFVVELPKPMDGPSIDDEDDDDYEQFEMHEAVMMEVNGMRSKCKAAIIAAGGTVKS